MERLRDLIERNKVKFGHFDYYLPIIAKAQANLDQHPDISIETSKALIEGVSKTIIVTLDRQTSTKDFKKKDVGVIVRDAMDYLSAHDDQFETAFVRRCVSLIYLHGEIRSARGDISHGQKAPKELVSTPQFAHLVYSVTEGLVEYLLKSFFKIEIAQDKEPEDEVAFNYEDDMYFNDWLDENYPMQDVSYSRALFDQDRVSYLLQYGDYKESLTQ